MSLGYAPPAEMAIADQKRNSGSTPSGHRWIIPKPDQTLAPEPR